jgi:hypothetical protein
VDGEIEVALHQEPSGQSIKKRKYVQEREMESSAAGFVVSPKTCDLCVLSMGVDKCALFFQLVESTRAISEFAL